MTTNTYTIKALESYRYDKEECLEALGYALSYDENNAVALCLMGRIQFEMFGNVESARNYFENALVADPGYSETYKHYFMLLISRNELETAKAFLKFMEKRIAYQPFELLKSEVLILEREFRFKKAVKVLNEALKHAFTEDDLFELDEIKSRLDRKQELKK